METNQTEESKRRGCARGCLIAIAICAGLGGLAMLVLAGPILMMLNGGGERLGFLRSLNASGTGVDETPFMVEQWSSGKGKVKVVRIPVEGMILLGNRGWRGEGSDTVLRSIRRATHDKHVKGLILEINSGGGGITDSDIIYRALLRFKEADEDRVIVSIFGDTAASGAYYIALVSDHILAHPTTITGSIGVVMQTYNFKELAQKIGISDVTITSGENKDMLNPFKDMSPEQQEMLQGIVTVMHGRFVSLVAQHRNLPKDVVAPLADGRIFGAEEALRHKLIDGIGYAEDAQLKIADLLGAEEGVKIFRYGEQVRLMDLIARPGLGFQSEMLRLLRNEQDGPRLMYKWSF
ncbi:MAG: signal peptide peptidase SppA [Kiritimatiellaeota bacterium]|nr:signal peptide peptidase SppA [Kiritimatiellota bacterium]